jgi:hypothetical protein
LTGPKNPNSLSGSAAWLCTLPWRPKHPSTMPGNGKLDLAVANSLSNTICVFLGNGDGTFRCAVHFPLLDSTDVQPLGLGVGDFNGDGRLDLAVSLRFLHRVAVLRNQVMAPVKK